jgi:hypothetical protein
MSRQRIACLKEASAAIGILLVAAGAAEALECPAVIMDRRDQFSFGQARLGDPPSRLPANLTRSRDCVENQPQGQFDCEYTDEAGASYTVKGQEIVAKEVRDVSRYRGTLPARISPGEPLLTVLNRLGSFSEGTPIWSLTPLPDGGVALGTDGCIENSNGIRGSYGFTFDRHGTLTSISARVL